MLLIAAFTITPIADAALCATDGQLSESSVVGDGDSAELSVAVDEEGHDGSSPLDLLQDHCEHGHCHHAASHITADTPNTNLARRQGHEWTSYQGAASYTPDGLMRPPKA